MIKNVRKKFERCIYLMEKSISKAKNLSKDKRDAFYQDKYDYYKKVNRALLIVAALAYISFFVTDCAIYERFAWETLVSRIAIVVPLVAFLILYKKTSNYKIMVFASYVFIHMIIWFTDWATYILPNREFAPEGMLVMNLIFVIAGFVAPYKCAIIAHSVLIVDILIAHQFIHYDNVAMMIMFNAPCIVAVCFMHYVMENVYFDRYLVNEKLESLVVHDQLTGVYNRNKFKKISDAETEEFTICQEKPLSIVMVDLDFFKKINDQYGHESGDIVLKHTAKVLVDSVRTSDYVIRWGGEEFIIILTGCNRERAIDIAEKIRVNIENSENTVCPVTASIGVAEYVGGSYHDVIECADVALYKAKKNGRNQVVEYKDE